MKKIYKQIGMLVLAICLILSIAPSVAARQCRTQNFESGYELTGYGPEDMLAIAFAQLGKTGTQMGYSEEWCADFVSDCAILAGQGDAIPAYAYCYGLYDAILSAGGTKTTSSPKPGDICFINWDGGTRFQHVEIVYKVENGMVYTIGGNTGGGSNLYKRCVALHDPLASNVIVSILRPKYKVLDISYATKCTAYDTYCTVRVIETPDLMSQPCDSATDAESVPVKTLKAEKEVKAYAVVENTLGQLWYKVKTGDTTAYLRATHTEFVDGVSANISVSDLTAPGKLKEGEGFSLTGKVTAKNLPLASVTGSIMDGDKVLSSATQKCTSTSCNLKSSAVNKELKFGALDGGKYTFVLTAVSKVTYAQGDNLKSYEMEVELYRGKFTVQTHKCDFKFAWHQKEHPHKAVYSCQCGATKVVDKETTLVDGCETCYPEPECPTAVPLPEENGLLPETLCFHPFFARCFDCEK